MMYDIKYHIIISDMNYSSSVRIDIIKKNFNQGSLTEGEGSVQLTS